MYMYMQIYEPIIISDTLCTATIIHTYINLPQNIALNNEIHYRPRNDIHSTHPDTPLATTQCIPVIRRRGRTRPRSLL